MGMFDNVIIDRSLLPLTEHEKKVLPKSEMSFQTKDFDNTLTEVFLTKDSISINRWKEESVPKSERPYPNDDGLKGLIGCIKRVDERRDFLLDFTGSVNFYDIGKDGTWIEFDAIYKDGKLVEIIRTSNELGA